MVGRRYSLSIDPIMSSGARDWWCPMCKFKIYGTKDMCAKCKSRRPGSRAPPPVSSAPTSPVIRPGDWACAHCQYNNFAPNVACRGCKKPRSDAVLTTSVRECVVCTEPKLETLFLPCGHLCTCRACATKVTECPMCRAAIAERKPVFIA
jgi:hypothetical protein